MSLGAIDFGLIVDGAVIVVENVVRHLSLTQQERRALGGELSEAEHLELVERAVLEVRGATIFGEAIIASSTFPSSPCSAPRASYFRPMATPCLFALSGAFILSLTVVPVLTSWFVSRETGRARKHGFCAKRIAIYVPGSGARSGTAGERSARAPPPLPRPRCSSPNSAPNSSRSSTRAAFSSRRAACPASRSANPSRPVCAERALRAIPRSPMS